MIPIPHRKDPLWVSLRISRYQETLTARIEIGREQAEIALHGSGAKRTRQQKAICIQMRRALRLAYPKMAAQNVEWPGWIEFTELSVQLARALKAEDLRRADVEAAEELAEERYVASQPIPVSPSLLH